MMIPVMPRIQTRHFPGQSFFLLRRVLSPARAEAVGEFERAIAQRFGVSHGTAFSSARSAAKALLMTLGYPPGATILMPSLNYPAIPRTVAELGYKVRWIPVRGRDLGPDFESLAGADLKDAVAMIWPHYFGIPGPVDALLEFCGSRGLDLIEDCAHAHGATYKGRPVGSFGRAAFVSFETSKMLNTFGGGMVLTSDDGLARKLGELRDGLPPRPAAELFKGVIKSYLERIVTSRWVFTLTLFQAIRQAKLAGKEDFLEEGIEAPAPREVGRYAPLQAETGLRVMKYFDRDLDELRRLFSAIQRILKEAGTDVAVCPEAAPNGYMTAGAHAAAGEVAAAFYHRGIDVKRRYMQDCQSLGFGEGAGHCPPVAETLFHVPVRTGLSGRATERYLAVIRDVLKDFSGRPQ